MAAVVLGNAAGLAANAAAAVHYHKAAQATRKTPASLVASFNTEHLEHVFSLSQEQPRLFRQSLSDVAVLLLLVEAFVAVKALCWRPQLQARAGHSRCRLWRVHCDLLLSVRMDIWLQRHRRVRVVWRVALRCVIRKYAEDRRARKYIANGGRGECKNMDALH